MNKASNKKTKHLLTIVYCAVLISMSIVLSRYMSFSIGNGIRISLGNLPIIIASLMFGPFAGAIVGFAADFIGATVMTGTTPAAFNPFLCIGPVLIGIIPAAIRRIAFNKKKVQHPLVALLLITLITHTCASIFVTTNILNYFFMSFSGVKYWIYLGTRVLIYLITAIIEAFAIFALVKARAVKIKNMNPAYKMSYEATTSYIHSVSWKGSRLGLTRINELTDKLGRPQDSLKFIHVAGTNGKGSVCAMLNSVLMEAGYNVGLYTSPYMFRFNERIQINGQPISDEDLSEVTSYVRSFADDMKDSPTEFELITAIALEFFKRKNCDIVVFEVGLGGELDSTNVISTPEVAVITKIDIDHIKELGPDLSSITRAKAGIRKDNGVVVSCSDSTGVIQQVCTDRNCVLHVMDDDLIKIHSSSISGNVISYKNYENVSIPLAGLYQPTNAAIALEVLNVLKEKMAITDEQIFTGMRKVKWPGRFEIMSQNPLFIYDGAHNMHGLRSSLKSLNTYFEDKKFILITGMMADKDVDNMVKLIAPCCKAVVATKPDNPRAIDPNDLIAKFIETGAIEESLCFATSDIPQAITRAKELAQQDDIICALGSLYMYKDIKGVFENDK